jgi:hypothetical protein
MRPPVTAPSDSDVLAAIEANYADWRVWRAGRGLVARKAGLPPTGPHARGDAPAELMRAIERADRYMTLTAAEWAALAAERLRWPDDAAALALATASKALAGLHGRGPADQRKGGRMWLYSAADPPDRRPGGRGPPADSWGH